MKNFTLQLAQDGIAVIAWDMPGRTMNVIDAETMSELEEIVERIAGDGKIRGAVFISGKSSFCGGADLRWLEGFAAEFNAAAAKQPGEKEVAALMERAGRFSRCFRRLETCGKPIAAAINGTCLGGGFELCLACHYRIAADDPNARLGFPEAKVGLLPGAGGTQRLPRLVGAKTALELMLEGRHIDPARALAAGAIHAVAPAASLLDAARDWCVKQATAVQPWDAKTFRVPGGTPYTPEGLMLWPAANALYRKSTYDNYEARRAIIGAVYEGLCVRSFDAALRIELRYFLKVLMGRQARAMIRSQFNSVHDLNRGARRPPEIARNDVGTLGIVGAGFMGAGIAHVSALAGMDVVLIDRELSIAEKAKEHITTFVEKEIARARLAPEAGRRALSRITPSRDHQALRGAALVIEAVFERREVKAAVLPGIEAVLAKETVLASNTSTLPISGLADYLQRPADFLGIHFFSPVDRMQLVEIIRGKKTSPSAIALAFDFVRKIGKTPILVNDARGFFTSRVVLTHKIEAAFMLSEGVPAALIENAARAAGMPVGPLALADEVALDLTWNILESTRKDLGSAYRATPLDRLLGDMVEKKGRYGRKNGKGFYDYPEGGKKRLWQGLRAICPQKDAGEFSFAELKERLLHIQALETARCFAENVLTDVREADVGAILGFGFAPFTGGPLSYIDGIGISAFLRSCDYYRERYGERFAPPELLLEMARKGETFYGKFSSEVRQAG